eukprot:GEMP01021532.1.p1 GENE.GEMP01021532.1~~GEMP01021532.1.p1  ORF type:complete len:530 (+),score=111.99 GEMP01021532.1:54-1643(+)
MRDSLIAFEPTLLKIDSEQFGIDDVHEDNTVRNDNDVCGVESAVVDTSNALPKVSTGGESENSSSAREDQLDGDEEEMDCSATFEPLKDEVEATENTLDSRPNDVEEKETEKRFLPQFECMMVLVMCRLTRDMENHDLMMARAEESRHTKEMKRISKLQKDNLVKLRAAQEAVVLEFELHQQKRPPKLKVDHFSLFPKAKPTEARNEKTIPPEGYKIIRRIEFGGFGKVYTIVRETDQQEFALKVDATTKDTIIKEAEVLGILQGPQIPRFYWSGPLPRKKTTSFGVVMDLLGPSLEECFKLRKRKFSLKTVRMIGEQMASALQYVHSKNVIHRDVKPENWCLGRMSPSPADTKTIFLVDFGLASAGNQDVTRKFTKSNSGNLMGTVRWISKNVHDGWSPSWRDDFESMAYVLLYLNRGSMPWYGISTSAKILQVRIFHLRRLILEKKSEAEDIFAKVPLVKIITHARSLDPHQHVDIDVVRNALAEFVPMKLDTLTTGCMTGTVPGSPEKCANEEVVTCGTMDEKRVY